MRRLLQRLLVVSFIGIIAAPPVANLLGVDGADPKAENRRLATFPLISPNWTSVKKFLPALDAWFTDHFAFRAELIRGHGITSYLWFGISPSSEVAVGPRGWLFCADENGLQDFTNAHPLSEAEIQNWRTAIVRAQKWCAARGIAYAFAVLPDKSSIYPELFPQTARRVNRLSHTDQVLAGMADTGAAIDVRQALIAEKRNVRLFQKTDTHWNSLGAYVGYRTIIDGLRRQNPAIPPPKPLSDFELVTRDIAGMDLAGLMGLKRTLREEDLSLVPKQKHQYVVREPLGDSEGADQARFVTEIPGSTLPRALVFRDSFASAMVPFFSEHFSRVVYLWRTDFAAAEIEKEHPDVVLQEIIGRYLKWFAPATELIPEP